MITTQASDFTLNEIRKSGSMISRNSMNLHFIKSGLFAVDFECIPFTRELQEKRRSEGTGKC